MTQHVDPPCGENYSRDIESWLRKNGEDDTVAPWDRPEPDDDDVSDWVAEPIPPLLKVVSAVTLVAVVGSFVVAVKSLIDLLRIVA